MDNDQLADVIHAYGITGSGSRLFYQEMEEVVVDSPIDIETENIVKILKGYAEIDQGSPEFYAHIMATFLYRGLDEFENPSDLSAVVKIASKATNMA